MPAYVIHCMRRIRAYSTPEGARGNESHQRVLPDNSTWELPRADARWRNPNTARLHGHSPQHWQVHLAGARLVTALRGRDNHPHNTRILAELAHTSKGARAMGTVVAGWVIALLGLAIAALAIAALLSGDGKPETETVEVYVHNGAGRCGHASNGNRKAR